MSKKKEYEWTSWLKPQKLQIYYKSQQSLDSQEFRV